MNPGCSLERISAQDRIIHDGTNPPERSQERFCLTRFQIRWNLAFLGCGPDSYARQLRRRHPPNAPSAKVMLIQSRENRLFYPKLFGSRSGRVDQKNKTAQHTKLMTIA